MRPDTGGSRARVLGALQRLAVAPTPAPALELEAVRFEDPVQRFAQALAAAGGECLVRPDAEGPADALRELPLLARAERWVSGVAGLPSSESSDAPEVLAGLDLAILPGAPAVAESGAVWVVPADRRLRAAAFLAEQLLLAVPRACLVHELHQAYARIDPAAAAFGCFIAGPSKTADIEQALVIGAHGPRALTAVLYGAPAVKSGEER